MAEQEFEKKAQLAGEAPASLGQEADGSTLSTDSAVQLELARKLTDEEWMRLVYRGDHVPQLTVRAVLLGGVLGSLMSICNLYTAIKVGWSFGVAITACVLSFLLWNGLRTIFPKISPMSILENNCMQSTASAAGYSTGATVGTAFGALLLITGVHVDWRVLLAWTFVSAALGVVLAVPMKRQMINVEKLPFPSGIAAAQTLTSLYGHSKHAVLQARALLVALCVGLTVGFFGKGEFKWQLDRHLKMPDLIPFPVRVNGIDCSAMPAFGFEPSVLLIGAGMIVGLRVSASMFLGSAVLYLLVGPYIVHIGEIPSPDKLIKGWSLWTGTAVLVTSGLTAFALKWQQIVRAAGSVQLAKSESGNPPQNQLQSQIEVPTSWLVAGIIPLTLAMVLLQYVAFSITWHLGLLAVVMSFFLALVACRSTGETDITPISAMGKITQLTYAVLAPSNITANLMAGSVTANIASSAADLLTDLKSGYLLGANPRKQFIAQFIGVFFGTLAIVPAWYLMVPNKAAMESFNAPSANMWRAVAEALAHGINYIPYMARWGLLVGGLLGIVLALLESLAPKRLQPYLPSAMGLGLSWVVPFSSCLSFLIGALVSYLWSKIGRQSASLFVIPIASGAVAGESLICAVIAMVKAASSFAK